MRPATIAAAVLACAAAAMVVVAFATGGDEERAASAPTPAPASSPDPAAATAGKEVWVANGCGSCHTFLPAGARGTFAPDLAASLKGMPASYIRESIVAPDAAVAAGFSACMMPDDYAARIPPAELDALVEFIRSGVRD